MRVANKNTHGNPTAQHCQSPGNIYLHINDSE
jgi:hypothetical protein